MHASRATRLKQANVTHHHLSKFAPSTYFLDSKIFAPSRVFPNKTFPVLKSQFSEQKIYLTFATMDVFTIATESAGWGLGVSEVYENIKRKSLKTFFFN